MTHPFFNFFKADRPFIDPNPKQWPSEWKTIRFKAYPRYPRAALPAPRFSDRALHEVIHERRSRRDFSGRPLELEELSSLLFFSCGLTKAGERPDLESRRAHPSGGALYPLESYLIVFRGNDQLENGIYHYNVLEHCLEKLPETNVDGLKSAFSYSWVASASAVLVLTFLQERNKPKYGNLAYKVGLIEAGHIGQNIYLNAAALGLKCSALGGLCEEKVHSALDIDGVSEVAFYAIAIGK